MDSVLEEVQNGIECFRKVDKIYCIPLHIAHSERGGKSDLRI